MGVLVASPWYLKSWVWTNNPVYPFFYRLFPRSVHWTQQAEEAYRMEQNSFGLSRGPGELVTAPWNTAMEGSAFFTVPTNSARQRRRPQDVLQAWMGDVFGSVGVALLGLVPLWPFAARRDWRVPWLLAYVGASMLSWFFLTQQTRYLLPVLAPGGVLGAVLLAWLPPGFLRIAAGCFVALTLGVNTKVLIDRTFEPSLPVVLGQESRDAYMARTLPDLYPALRFVNTLPPDSRVAFFQEVRGYYADREYFWANPLQHDLVPYEDLKDGAELARFLRAKLGITHVLINANFLDGSEGTRWYQLLQDAAARGALRLLYDVGRVRIYAIV
jgi:hypothetical protein